MDPHADKLLIGDNPFIGVDHLSQERLREKNVSLDTEKIAKVLDSAFQSGAQGLLCSAHPTMKQVLQYLKKGEYDRNFSLHLIVPDAQSYVRTASEKGLLGLLSETFGNLGIGGKAKAIFRGGLSALTFDPVRMMKSYLEMEYSIFQNALPSDYKLRTIFIHELLTELIISFKMGELTHTYIDYLENSLGVRPGFVTRNFKKFVDFGIETGLPMDKIVVLTPFNKVGFQMNPSRAECEEYLLKIPSTEIIAMSILASGYLNLEEALEYLKGLKKSVSCVVGVSTETHARETFSKLRSSLITP